VEGLVITGTSLHDVSLKYKTDIEKLSTEIAIMYVPSLCDLCIMMCKLQNQIVPDFFFFSQNASI
jgi:hypothetical protein